MWRKLYHVFLADFRERIKSKAVLVLPVVAAYLGHWLTGGGIELVVGGGYTGRYNLAWIAGVMCAAGNLLLMIFGYFVVKGTLQRDRASGVGELVATTPVGRTTYLYGKWLSHLAVLGVIAGLLALTALGAFGVGGHGPFDLLSWVGPFIGLMMPAMALVAAVAIVFEVFEWLRGALGSSLYIIGIFSALAAAMLAGKTALDPFGLVLFEQSMRTSIAAQFPSFDADSLQFAFQVADQGSVPFHWDGIRWTVATVCERLAMVGVAGVLVGVASVFFDRFDGSSKARTDSVRSAPKVGDSPVEATGEAPGASRVELTPVSADRILRFGRIWAAEFKIALKGQRWWWYAAVVGAIALGAFGSLKAATGAFLPFAWLLPLPLWSAMGVRQTRHQTDQLILTSSYPRAQFVAAWLAGVAIALLAGGGVLVNLAIAGQLSGIGAIFAGAVFVASLAMACGTWSKSERLFEALYLMLWYLGPVSKTVALDFMGAVPGAASRVALVYAVAAAALFAVAFAGRRRG